MQSKQDGQNETKKWNGGWAKEKHEVPNHIDAKKTIEKYGYDPAILKPKSERLVVSNCIICNQERNRGYGASVAQKKCFACSRIEIFTVENLSKFGKLGGKARAESLTAEQRKEVGIKGATERWKKGFTEETRLKLSASNSGKDNPFYGKKHKEETLIVMRETAKKNVRRGKESNFYGKINHGRGQWFYPRQGPKIWMRSSWEIKYAIFLTIREIDWIYEYKSFPVTYNYNGYSYTGTYTPDFYLVNTNEYIEVKGYWRGDAYSKYKAFRNQYPNFKIQVFDKVKMKKFGIL